MNHKKKKEIVASESETDEACYKASIGAVLVARIHGEECAARVLQALWRRLAMCFFCHRRSVAGHINRYFVAIILVDSLAPWGPKNSPLQGVNQNQRCRRTRQKKIGATRFERATFWSQTRRSARLSYAPIRQFSDDVGTPVEDVRVREGERLANVSVSRKSTWEFLATEFFQ